MNGNMHHSIEEGTVASPAVPADGTPKQGASDRYLGTLQALIDDAAANDRVRELADAIALAFARIAIGCGLSATADMMRLLGKYLASLEAQRQAEEELARERAAGRVPN